MSEKIGVGVITFNREDLFWKCWRTLEESYQIIDEIVVVNDGKPYTVVPTTYSGTEDLIQHKKPLGVGKSKNEALTYLLNKGCDHIFLIEDDIFIKDSTVFEKYIQASKSTGIQHFNFSQHGLMNKTFDGTATPNPRVVIDYGKIKLPLYPHCVGAFSYYSKKCLEEVGLMDERYYNACEHVDHTYEIIKAGMHPPFWYFADIENSWEYLGDEPWSIEKSTISSNPNHKKMMEDADKIFVEKHGCLPGQIKDRYSELGIILKKIKEYYGKNK
jgi:GT2 family glycosyltransferase